jgi:hypothetical protein
VRSLFRIFLAIVLILVLALIAELIPPFRQLTNYFDQNPQPYKAIAIGISIAGWILMAGVIAYMIWKRGKSSTDDKSSRMSGLGQRREFYREVTFLQIKEAWQSGQWIQTQWLPIFLGLLALIFITIGMFGFFFIIGPPLVKLLGSCALVYAAVRTVQAFWNA